MITPVLTAAEAAAWDQAARDQGMPSRVLMESAGRAVATVLAKQFEHALGQGVLVVCGTGNNGGDGWVAARALASLGVRVTAVALEGQCSPDNIANRDLAVAHGVKVVGRADDWGPTGVVVDAVLGGGAVGTPSGESRGAIERLMRLGAPVVAVDGPSGLDLTTGAVHAPCVRAALTVTFGGFRRGHLLQRTVCGRVVVAEIGFPPAAPAWPAAVSDAWLSGVLNPFSDQTHKAERGKVVVAGGDEGMAGAVLFAAKAALRSGSGLAKLVASAPTVVAAQATNPDIMAVVSALDEGLIDPVLEALAWADALVLGPGLGRGPARGKFARKVLAVSTSALVLDADGLMAFKGAVDELRDLLGTRRALLTPHRGEFASLFPKLAEQGRRDPFGAASAAADQIGHAVLLKGVPTVVAAPGQRALVSATGNPGLATGGTGDVLAGMAAMWLAVGADPQVAGAAAAHVHGRAAEDVARHRSVRSLRPDDLLGVLSPLWRELADRKVEVDPPILAELDVVAVN